MFIASYVHRLLGASARLSRLYMWEGQWGQPVTVILPTDLVHGDPFLYHLYPKHRRCITVQIVYYIAIRKPVVTVDLNFNFITHEK